MKRDEDETLHAFLEAIERVKRERSGALDEETRQRIARELGWSEEDLRTARAVGEAKLEKGRAFLAHGVDSEALLVLREAEALLPDDARVLLALAESYAHLGETAAAKAYALRCVALEPKHQAAYALLATLSRRRQRRLSVALAIAVVAALGAGAIVMLRSGVAPITPGSAPASAPTSASPSPPASSPIAASPLWRGAAVACASRATDHCEVALLPRVNRSLAGAQLWLDDALCALVNDYNGPKVRVAGRVDAALGNELEELTVQLVQLEAGGRELGRSPLALFPAFEPRLRPGASHVFFMQERALPGVDKLVIEPSVVRAAPAPARYDPLVRVAVTFAPGLVRHFSITAGVAQSQVETYDRETSLSGVLEVQNQGPNVVHSLTFRAECQSPAGKVVDVSEQAVAYSHMPPMRAGERRLVSFSCFVVGKLEPLSRIVVTEID